MIRGGGTEKGREEEEGGRKEGGKEVTKCRHPQQNNVPCHGIDNLYHNIMVGKF